MSRRRRLRRLRRPQVALIALVAAVAIGYAINAVRGDEHASPGGATPSVMVSMSALPPQVSETVRLVRAGGPFPYPQDGAVFHNAERRLPSEPDGYYHEFTVPTPGSPDRGARRIITGAGGEFYYTADHYETFERLDVTG